MACSKRAFHWNLGEQHYHLWRAWLDHRSACSRSRPYDPAANPEALPRVYDPDHPGYHESKPMSFQRFLHLAGRDDLYRRFRRHWKRRQNKMK